MHISPKIGDKAMHHHHILEK